MICVALCLVRFAQLDSFGIASSRVLCGAVVLWCCGAVVNVVCVVRCLPLLANAPNLASIIALHLGREDTHD
jgi:hypothetical protein